MARTYEEMKARLAEIEKAQAPTTAPIPAPSTAPAARAPVGAAARPAVVSLPKPSAALPAPTVTRAAKRVTPKVEKVEPPKAPEVAPPKPLGLTPDLAKPVDYKRFYDNAEGTFSGAMTRTANSLGMTEAELKRLSQAQGVDLESIYKAGLKGRTYEEIAAAGRERGVIGFMPLEEREKAFTKLATDVEKAQRGDAGDTIELVRSAADKGFGPAKALAGYTFAGTEAELPEVTKPGEHGYAVASLLVEALQKDPSAVRVYDLYGRSLATGGTQQYIEDRVQELRKRANIKVADADAMEKMAALRRRAINEVIAYKTVGQWTPVVTLGDIEVTEGRASPGLLGALAPNIELIGFNNKRQAVFRQESPMGVLFRAIDIPQSAFTGVLSGQTMAQGVQTGANLLEYTLEATKDSAPYVKAPAVAAGFLGSVLFPDMLAVGGVAGKAAKSVTRLVKARKIAPRALELTKTIAEARKAGDYAKASTAERELRNALPAAASTHDSFDAATARFMKLAEPESDIMDTDLAALIATAYPAQAIEGASRSFLHPSARKDVISTKLAGKDVTSASYDELYDTQRLLDRVAKARADYIESRRSNRSVAQYAKDYVRGRVRDVFENLPAELQISAAEIDRLADIVANKAPIALTDPKQFKNAVEAALKADATFSTDAYKVTRQDVYKTIGGRTEQKLAEIATKTMEEIEAPDIGLFDRALKAIKQNSDARGIAAQLLHDEIASTARLRVEPLNLFDDVAPKVDGEPVRLTPGGLLLLSNLRKAYPAQDFKQAYASVVMIDRMVEGAAKSREVSPFALYQELFPAIKRGTPEDLKRLMGDLKAGKVPTGGAPAAPAAAPTKAPSRAAVARAEAQLRTLYLRMSDAELDEIEALLRADGVEEGEAYALDALKREKARRAREAKKAAAAAPAPTPAAPVAPLSEPEAAPTPVVAEEVVEAPAAAPVVEAPPVATSAAPTAGLVSAQRTDFKSVDEFKQAVIDAGGVGFITKQGSVYQQTGPVTQRFKTLHIEHDPKDIGLKKPSKRTIYLRAKLEGGGPDRLRETGVGLSNASTRWLIDDTTNRAYLVSRVKDGPIKEYRFDVLRKDADGKTIPFVEFDTQPFMGAVVLELFDDAAPVPTMVGKDKVADLPGHKSFHPGNQITEMFGPVAVEPPTPAPIVAAAEAQPEAAKIVEVPAPAKTPAPAGLKSPDVTWVAFFRKTIKPEKPSDALRAVSKRVIDLYEDEDFAQSLTIREATVRLTGKTPEEILAASGAEREAFLEALDVDGGVSEFDLERYTSPREMIGLTPNEALELGGFPAGTKAADLTPAILDDLTERVAEIAGEVGGPKELEPRLREMGGASVESLADVRYNAKDLQGRIVPIEKDAAFDFVRKTHSKLPDPRSKGLLASVGVAAGGDLRVVGLLNTPSAKYASDKFDGIVELSRVASDGKLKSGSSAITYWAMQNLQRFNRSGDPAKARLVTTSLLTEPGEVYKALEPEGLHPTSLVNPSEGTGSRAGAKDTARKGEWKINWEFGPAAAPEAPHLYHLQPVYRDVVMNGEKLSVKRLNSLVQREGTDLVDAYKDAARVLGVPLKDEPALVAASRKAARATPEGRRALADDIRYMLLEKFNSKAVADADRKEQAVLRAKAAPATRVKPEAPAPAVEVAPEVKPVVEAMAETEKKFAEAQKKSAADAASRAEAIEKARQEKSAKKLAELEAQRKVRDAEKQKRLEAYQAEQVRLAEEKAKKLAEREAKAKAKAEEAAKRLADRQAKEAEREALRVALEAQRKEEERLFIEAAQRAEAEKARKAADAAARKAAEEKRAAEEAARKMAEESARNAAEEKRIAEAAARKAAEEKRAAEKAAQMEQRRVERALREAESQKLRAEVEEASRKRQAEIDEKYRKLRAQTEAENRKRQAELEEETRKRQANLEEEARKRRMEIEEKFRKIRAEADARAAEAAEYTRQVKARVEADQLAADARDAAFKKQMAEAAARKAALDAEFEAERAARVARQAEREAEAARVAVEAQRKAAEAREALRVEYPQLADFEDRFPVARPANLKAVLREVRESTTNESYKRIIDRLLAQGGRFDGTQFQVAQAGDVVNSSVANSLSSGASGTMHTVYNDAASPLLVHIRGTSLGKIDFPLDEVIVHEAIHAATVDQYEIGIRIGAKGTPVAAAAEAINNLHGQVVGELKRRLTMVGAPFVAGSELMGFSQDDLARMVNKPTELIAYGMTNPQFQSLLKTIKVESAKSAWTKFVEGVARLLGLAPGDESALSVLIERTERLMDLSPDELEATRRMVFPNATPAAGVSEASAAPTPSGIPATRAVQTETPEFKRWFGDSKVVDAEGKPLVVYHGSSAQNLTVLSPEGAQEVPGAVFFTNNIEVAEQYRYPREYGEVVTEVYDEDADDYIRLQPGDLVRAYLSMRNPLEVDFAGALGESSRIGELVRRAKTEGRDGVIIQNVDDTVDSSRELGTTYIVFEPTQIKSATGNVGTFSQTDPSILKQVSPTGELKGAVDWQKDGSGIIYLFEGADASTVLHEVAHVVRRNILSNDDMGLIASWVQGLGVDVGHQYGEFTGDADKVEQAEELFAKAFEQYVAEGKAPDAGLVPVFEQLKKTIAEVYKGVKDPVIGVELQPEVRQVFDRLLAQAPEQANSSLKEAVRRGILGGPEKEVRIFDVLAREAKRRGLAKTTADELLEEFYDAKATIRKSGREVKGTDTVFEFKAPILGKKKWTFDDLLQAQQVRDVRMNAPVEARAELLLDLMGRGKGKAALVQEDSAVESIWSAIAAREGDAPTTMLAKSTLRLVAGAFFGGDIVSGSAGSKEAAEALRNSPPEFRRAMDASAAVVEQGISDTVSLVNDAIEANDNKEFLRFLVGDSDIRRRDGRPILSSGHDKMAAFNRMVTRAINQLTDDERAALIIMADTLNIKDPSIRGRNLTRLGFKMEDGQTFKVVDAASQKIQDDAVRAIGRLLYPAAAKDADFGTSLATAIRNAIGAPDIARPSHEWKLVETLSYLGGVTARDGKMFSGTSTDVADTLFKDVRAIYQKDEIVRRVAVLVGSFGAADQAKDVLVRMNLGVRKDTQLAFYNFTVGEQIGAKNIEPVQQMINKFGLNVNLVEDAVLDVDYYIPRQARERMAASLSRATFRPSEQVTAGDAFDVMFRYMKLRMTRGNFFIRQRYFMMNTVDHFNAMAYTAGFGVAAASTARVIAQDLIVLPGFRELIELSRRIPGAESAPFVGKYLTPYAMEKIRANLQSGGDVVAQKIGTMLSVSKYRVEVNPILEGSEGVFEIGGKVYRHRDIRDIAVEEGVFASFDTRELQRVILREGQFVQTAVGDSSLATASKSRLAFFKNVLADWERSTTDIAEAWGERERLGAMVTLMEFGYDPRVAARLTTQALFNYSQSMTKGDRAWYVGILLPFWAFQKNANRQVFDLMFSPWGAYRMMAIKRMRDRSADLLTNILYNTTVDDYGVDVESMPPELQDSYYGIITAFEQSFGPNGPSPEQKRAMRYLLAGRAMDVEKGKLMMASAEIQRLRMAGGFADLQKFAPFSIPEPSASGRTSTVRDRSGVAVTFPRTETTRIYHSLLGDNHAYMELFWPESTIEAGMRWHTQVAAAMLLTTAKGVDALTPVDLTPYGIDEVSILGVAKPILDPERSPVLGPLLAGEFTSPPPKRITAAATPEAWAKVHPMLGKMMDDLYGTSFLRVPAVMDPLLADEEGRIVISPEQRAEIKRLQEQYPDVAVLKDQRYYLEGGVWATAFENSPLGELNSQLLRWEEEPLERADIRGEMLRWARAYAGADVLLTAPSRAVKFEEPKKKTETAGTKTF